MIRLYTENECYTDLARNIDHEVSTFISKLLDRYIEHGVSIRDLESVVSNAVHGVSAEKLLRQQWLVAKAKRVEVEKGDTHGSV